MARGHNFICILSLNFILAPKKRPRTNKSPKDLRYQQSSAIAIREKWPKMRPKKEKQFKDRLF